MNEARQRELLAGVATNARRVFDCVPIATAWSLAQLIEDLRRSGSGMDTNVLKGCLASLMDRGLVIEGPAKHYRRVPIRARTLAADPPTDPQPQVEPMAQPPNPAPPAAPASTPHLERFAAIAIQLRAAAAALTAIAKEIDDAALDVDADLSAVSADTQKLRTLRGLLKELT